MPNYFNDKSDRMIALFQQLEDFILYDIARRLIKAGKLTATADRLVWKLEQMGEHKSAIMEELATLTAMTTTEMRSLLQEAVLTSWEDDNEVFKQLGVKVKSPLENKEVIRVMDAEYKKTLGELQNLTRTTMNTSQRNLINMLDEAELRVSSGVQSYNSAICDILDNYAGKGVMVEYPTGAKRTLESAVRCCVVTGLSQTAAQVSLTYMQQAKTNLILVSAHSNARYTAFDEPANHMSWQGKVYQVKDEDLKRLTIF
jgi:hypothetical protein